MKQLKITCLFLLLNLLPLWTFSQTTYTQSPTTYVCGNYDSGGNGHRIRIWPTTIPGSLSTFRVRKATNSTCSGSGNFGTSGTVRIRENSITGTIVETRFLSSVGGSDFFDIDHTLSHSSGTINYYVTIDAAGFTYWAGPIAITASTTSSITISNPSGGTYDKGCNMGINWSSSGVGSNVSIELVTSTGTSPIAIIADPTNNDGSFNWTVGTNLSGAYPTNIPSGNYRIKVYETGTGNGVDYSNVFSISNPTLTINSPNGGQTFNIGGSMPITWSSNDFCGNVSLELVNSSNNFVALIADNTSNDGSYTWSISGVSAGNYKVKIYKTVSSGSSPVIDYSNSTFSIDPAVVPSITVSSPTGGTHNKGCTMGINWSSTSIGSNVSIELVSATGTSPIAVIADPTNNDGSFNWTVGTNESGAYPTNIPSGTYRIKMYETGTGSGVDYSNIFTISNPLLTVIAPNGGETYNLGGSMPITWSSNNFCGNVSIELVNSSNNFVALIADNTSNDGSHTWSISGVSAGNYKVKIYKTVSSGTSPVIDYSNSTFTIDPAVVSSISISSPTGGTHNKGCDMSINWSSTSIGSNVSIELVSSTGTTPIAVIADPTNNDGNFTWTIGTNVSGAYPTNIPSGTYRIKMYETGTGSGVDYSNIFTISNPLLTVIAPNGGETYNIGGSMPISWSSNNFCGNVSLELVNSSNNFVALIVDDTPNDGSHTWSISGVSAGNYKIKIYKTVPSGSSPVIDYSNSTFTINSAGSADLDLNGAISISPASPIQGSSATFQVTVINNGSASWTGNLAMQLLDANSNYLTDLDLEPNITINAGSTQLLFHNTASIGSAPGSYFIQIVAQDNGTGSYYAVDGNGFSNPKSFTILAPGGADLDLNETISISPASPVQGSAATFQVNIINNGAASWTGNLAMQLLDANSNYLTDLDLESNITINAGSTQLLFHNTSSIGSVPGAYFIQIVAQDNGTGSYYVVDGNGFSNPKSFTIIAPGAADLDLNEAISISPASPMQGAAATFQVNVINNGSASWTGNLAMQLLDASSTLITDLDLENGVTLNPGNTELLFHNTSSIGSAPGNYFIQIVAQDNGTGLWYVVSANGFSNPKSFTILNNNPATGLSFTQCINAPATLLQGNSLVAAFEIVNLNASSWTGDIVVTMYEVGNSTNLQTLYDANHTISAGNTLSISSIDDGNDIISLSTGNYRIIVAYDNAPGNDLVEAGSCSPNAVLSSTGTTYHYHSISVTLTGNCTINDPPPSQVEAHTAASYLCGEGIIDQPSAPNYSVNPSAKIIREDMAKVAFLAVYGANNPTIADNFPTPFGDLQGTWIDYYRYAKTLSYLEYGDGVSPFSRRFFNFRPGDFITRGQVCKVLVETFDIDLSTSASSAYNDVFPDHPEFSFIVTMEELGIINNSIPSFRPNDDALREEVFIMLWRLLTQCGSCLDNAGPMNNPANADFFNPGNYTPENLSHHASVSDGNFDGYRPNSFMIPGRNMPLLFEHYYNNYLTEVPDEWCPIMPMGPGWSHNYNIYLVKLPGWTYNTTTVPDKFAVFWAGNSVHFYEDNGGSSPPLISEGVYDETTYFSGSNKYVIKKKNQTEFTFETIAGASNDIYVLRQIEDRNGNTVSLNYELYSGSNIRLKEVIGTANRKLTFSYFANTGRVKSVQDPINRNVQFTYGGPSGIDLQTYKDPESKETTYNYGTSAGQEHLLTIITLPNGNFINNQYFNKKLTSTTTNNVNTGQTVEQQVSWSLNSGINSGTTSEVKILNNNAVVRSYEYVTNNLGQLTEMDGPVNDVDEVQYNDANNPTLPTSVTIDGFTTTYQYDNDGNVTQINQPLSVSHQFTYTSLNDINTYTNPRSFVTDFNYNGSGNLTSIISPIGTTTISYNSYGQPTSVTNPENITVSFGYNSYGNQNSVNAPLSINSSANYDNASRLLSATNPNNQVVTYEYDNRDFVTKTIDALGHETEFNYDGNGNLTQIENAKNEVTTLTYNYFDWLVSESFGGSIKNYEYDDEGRLKKLIKPDGTSLDYSYNISTGNLTSDDYANFTYDSRNRMKTVQKIGGQTLTYNYDALNRITSTVYDGQTVSYQYDLNSNITKVTYPDGKQVTYTYDAKDRMKTVKDWNNNTTTYNYLNDNRLSTTIYPNGITTTYTYDGAGRMVNMESKDGVTTICAYGYTLDKVGNHSIEAKTEPYDYSAWASLQENYTYNNANRIINSGSNSFSFDNNGNTVAKTGKTYIWDDHDKLLTVSGNFNATYEYDGLGNRRKATREGVTRKFTLDILGMSKILMESDNSNNPTDYYVYGLGLISRVKPNGNTHYYCYDFRGSTIAMTDANANITHKYSYDEFGGILEIDEADENRFRYVGKFGVMYENDDLVFMRARYYDSEIGRFLNEDPIWSTNLYPYAGNNPITRFDPEGTQDKFYEDIVFLIETYDVSQYSKNAAYLYERMKVLKYANRNTIKGFLRNTGSELLKVSPIEATFAAIDTPLGEYVITNAPEQVENIQRIISADKSEWQEVKQDFIDTYNELVHNPVAKHDVLRELKKEENLKEIFEPITLIGESVVKGFWNLVPFHN